MTTVVDTTTLTGLSAGQLLTWRVQLDCGFAEVNDVFDVCMAEASSKLSPEGMGNYLGQARFLGKMGRGVEPALIFLQEWPPLPTPSVKTRWMR